MVRSFITPTILTFLQPKEALLLSEKTLNLQIERHGKNFERNREWKFNQHRKNGRRHRGTVKTL